MSLFRRRRDDVAEPSPVAVAGPVTRGEIADRLQAAAPHNGSNVADSLLPAIRYATRREPDAGIDVGRSKFGGSPDLPQGAVWPRWTPPGGDEQFLQFFAQLDLAEAAGAAASDLGLPHDGLLSFFADLDAGRTLVLHSPADVVLHRLGLRREPLPAAQLHALGTWTWPPGPAGSLNAVRQELETGLRALAPEHYLVTANHQLGGHVAGTDGFVLFQFDSDHSLELAWGPSESAGRLVWTIPTADLTVRRWDAARLKRLTP